MKKFYILLFFLLSLPFFAQVKPDNALTVSERQSNNHGGENKKEKFSVSTGEGFLLLYNLRGPYVRYQLFDLTGKVVMSDILMLSVENKINTSGLINGIYLLKIRSSDNSEAVRKVFVK